MMASRVCARPIYLLLLDLVQTNPSPPLPPGIPPNLLSLVPLPPVSGHTRVGVTSAMQPMERWLHKHVPILEFSARLSAQPMPANSDHPGCVFRLSPGRLMPKTSVTLVNSWGRDLSPPPQPSEGVSIRVVSLCISDCHCNAPPPTEVSQGT